MFKLQLKNHAPPLEGQLNKIANNVRKKCFADSRNFLAERRLAAADLEKKNPPCYQPNNQQAVFFFFF